LLGLVSEKKHHPPDARLFKSAEHMQFESSSSLLQTKSYSLVDVEAKVVMLGALGKKC